MRKIVPFQKCSREEQMRQGIASYAERMVKEAAEPVSPGEKIKEQMNRACTALGYPLGHWRVRAAWNKEAECWSARALMDLENRYQRWRVRQQKRANAEARKAAAVFDALADRLGQNDEGFHSEDIASLLSLARRLRGEVNEQVK